MWKWLPGWRHAEQRAPTPFLMRLGALIIRWRFPITVVIGGLTVIFALQLRHLRTSDDEHTWFSSDDPILEDYRRVREEFPIGHNIVIAFPSPDPLDSLELRYLRNLGEKLLQVPYATEAVSLANVEEVIGTEDGLLITPLVPEEYSPNKLRAQLAERIKANPFIYGNLVGRDWQTLALLLKIEIPDTREAEQGNIYIQITRELRRLLEQETRATGREFHFSSDLVMDGEINAIIYHDIALFFPLSLLVSFLTISYLFRSAGAVLISLATVSIALIWTLGLMGGLNVPLSPVSTTLFALVNIIGLANAIHLLSQWRLEVHNGYDHHQAALRALASAGKPCFFTSLTTAVGFGSLVVSRIPAIRHLGYFAGFGVMVTYLLALVMVPIVAARPGFKMALKTGKRGLPFTSLLKRIAACNLRHPRLVIVVHGVLIVALAGGIPMIQTEASLLEYLKHTSRLYRDTQFIDKHLAGVSSLEVILAGDEGAFTAPAPLQLLIGLQDTLSRVPYVGASYAATDLLRLINRALHAEQAQSYCLPGSRDAVAQSLLLYEIAGGGLSDEYLSSDYSAARLTIITRQCTNAERQQLLSLVQNYCRTYFSSFTVTITGIDYLVNSITNRIIRTQIESLLLAFGVIALLMVLQFGWRAGIISLIPNLFPVVLTFGLMGFGGFRLNMATAIIAAIAIGIVVDDTIHYFSHFRARFDIHGERKIAMQEALLEVGPAMISASMVLVLGFAIEILSQTSILLDFGILAGVAILGGLIGDLFLGPVLLSRWRVFHLSTSKSASQQRSS